MKKAIAIALAVSLIVGVVACTSVIPLWDHMTVYGAESSNTTIVEGNIMAVFWEKATDRVVLWCYNAQIIDRGDGTWDVSGEGISAGGVKQALVDYALYHYEPLPNPFENTYYLYDLDLQPITAEDLPQSTHVAALKNVYLNGEGRPRVDVWRLYMGIAYEVTNCRVTQTAYDQYVDGKIELYDPLYNWLAPENEDCFVAVDYIHENFTGEDVTLIFVDSKLFR